VSLVTLEKLSMAGMERRAAKELSILLFCFRRRVEQLLKTTAQVVISSSSSSFFFFSSFSRLLKLFFRFHLQSYSRSVTCFFLPMYSSLCI
jgi:hypothetical protein